MRTGPVYNGDLYVTALAYGLLSLFLVHLTGDNSKSATFCAATSFFAALAGLVGGITLVVGYAEFSEISPAGSGGRIAVNMLWLVNAVIAVAIGYLLITKRNTAPIPSDTPPS